MDRNQTEKLAARLREQVTDFNAEATNLARLAETSTKTTDRRLYTLSSGDFRNSARIAGERLVEVEMWLIQHEAKAQEEETDV